MKQDRYWLIDDSSEIELLRNDQSIGKAASMRIGQMDDYVTAYHEAGHIEPPRGVWRVG